MKLAAQGGLRDATWHLLPLGNNTLFLAKKNPCSRQRAQRWLSSSQNKQPVPLGAPMVSVQSKVAASARAGEWKQQQMRWKTPETAQACKVRAALQRAETPRWEVLWEWERSWKWPIKRLDSMSYLLFSEAVVFQQKYHQSICIHSVYIYFFSYLVKSHLLEPEEHMKFSSHVVIIAAIIVIKM